MKIKKKNSKKNKGENANTIHIKIEYEESLNSKKDLLSSEMSLINAIKAIQKYHLLRNQELKLKLKTYTRLRSLKTDIGKLHKILPKIKIPKILEKTEPVEEKEKKKPEKIHQVKPSEDQNLESELMEIQNKLNSLAQYK